MKHRNKIASSVTVELDLVKVSSWVWTTRIVSPAILRSKKVYELLEYTGRIWMCCTKRRTKDQKNQWVNWKYGKSTGSIATWSGPETSILSDKWDIVDTQSRLNVKRFLPTLSDVDLICPSMVRFVDQVSQSLARRWNNATAIPSQF